MNNMERLYLINFNLNILKNNISQYNMFDNVGFADEIKIFENMINRMKEVLDDMKGEK